MTITLPNDVEQPDGSLNMTAWDRMGYISAEQSLRYAKILLNDNQRDKVEQEIKGVDEYLLWGGSFRGPTIQELDRLKKARTRLDVCLR